MNLRMGGQVFRDVQIPILWGDRAVIQDRHGRLSVIDLSGEVAHVEILADEPAPGIEFRPRIDGVAILREGTELYSYDPREKLLISISLGLPECEISPQRTRVGTQQFIGNIISGHGVGIAVTRDEIRIGAPLPPRLAKLVV
jgi:hypothetical protein